MTRQTRCLTRYWRISLVSGAWTRAEVSGAAERLAVARLRNTHVYALQARIFHTVAVVHESAVFQHDVRNSARRRARGRLWFCRRPQLRLCY